ncbi:MAG TPA: hypothetical protein VGB30_08130, partial [bacterium]
MKNIALVLILMSFSFGCAGNHADPIRSDERAATDPGTSEFRMFPEDGHTSAVQALAFDPATGDFEFLPERTTNTHYDLAYFWKYFPNMLKLEKISHSPADKKALISIEFTNPFQFELRDVRFMFPADSPLTPIGADGWTTRTGASEINPDPFIAYAKENPLRAIQPGESSSREITFHYKNKDLPGLTTFVLDAVVADNTSEPYEFGPAELTGRFFHIQISDWQDDITTAYLDMYKTGYGHKIRLAQFGDDGEWGGSIPDIADGNYRLLLTAVSPKSQSEDGDDAPYNAYHWINFSWPPEDGIVPLPTGKGVYGFRLENPNTNKLPVNFNQFISSFRDEMGGEWLIIEYGEICNSGYLAEHDWISDYVKWMNLFAPEVQVHLNFDNLGFPPASLDPCMDPPEKYTQVFFDHLLESIRTRILENPDYNSVVGLHFDIEPFPEQHQEPELFQIYKRYADFLGRLHIEPDLNGRVITVYEWLFHPHYKAEDLPYLCTTDAYMASCYYDRFSYYWDYESKVPFDRLESMLQEHRIWAEEYGRPFYPILGSYSAWYDDNEDTLQNITICGIDKARVIDEYCFGKGPLNTIDEFDIVKARDVHGLFVESVLLNKSNGDPILPGNGGVAFRLGDLFPTTVGDDIVFCRTGYAATRAIQIVEDHTTSLNPGHVIFRYENNQIWKAYGFRNLIPRGAIGGISGRVRFGDGLSLPQHPELWDSIRVELVDPLTPEITGNPVYR